MSYKNKDKDNLSLLTGTIGDNDNEVEVSIIDKQVVSIHIKLENKVLISNTATQYIKKVIPDKWKPEVKVISSDNLKKVLVNFKPDIYEVEEKERKVLLG